MDNGWVGELEPMSMEIERLEKTDKGDISNTKKDLIFLFILAFIFSILSFQNYLLFHSLAEIFSVLIAVSFFIIIWNSQKFSTNDYLLFLGIAFLFVSGIDFVHMLSYKGMGVFPGYDANLPTQLWIMARYMQSISFLASFYYLSHGLDVKKVFAIYSGALLILFSGVFYYGFFPTAYVEDVGLTRFKIISEYVIIFILVLALYVLIKNKDYFKDITFRYLSYALVFTMASELSFTFYVSVYGFSNYVGHIFKIISFYFIYLAIVKEVLTDPFSSLFRQVVEYNEKLEGVITECKQAEEALRESEELHRITLSNISDAVFITDAKGKFTFICPNVKVIFGYSYEEVEKFENISNLIGDDLFDIEDLKNQGEIRNIGRDIAEKSGRIHSLLVNVKDVDIKGGTILYSCRDITERKRAEDALMKAYNELELRVEKRTVELKESEEKYRTLIESSSDCICHIDLEGRFVYMNPGGLKLNALESFEEISGQDCTATVKEEYKDLMEDALEKAKKGETTNLEYESTNAKGKDQWWESIIGPIKDKKGDVKSMIRISRDITERKRAEEEMKWRLMKFRLEEGSLYLVQEPVPSLSLEALKDLLKIGYRGIVISRTPEEKFKSTTEGNIKFLWISEKGGENALPPKLKEIENKIDSLPRRCVVLIERLDYLVFRNNFKKTLSFVQRLRELAYLKRHIVILSVDPSTFAKRELRLLEKETEGVERLLKARLAEDLLEVLRFIYQQNNLGVKPSYTDVGIEFGISRPTSRKRIKRLVSAGYLMDVIRGNRKVLEMTKRGRELFFE